MPYPFTTPNYNSPYVTPYQYTPYQQGYTQPTYQQPTIQQTPAQQQSSIIWVSGLNEAQMYPVAPNNAVTLWSQNEPVVYLKQADATGKPTLKTYDLVERVEVASTATDSDKGNVTTYATKDELTAVVGAVKGIDGVISALRADMDTLKGDMYGIAGKKKAAPKRKDDTDDE